MDQTLEKHHSAISSILYHLFSVPFFLFFLISFYRLVTRSLSFAYEPMYPEGPSDRYLFYLGEIMMFLSLPASIFLFKNKKIGILLAVIIVVGIVISWYLSKSNPRGPY